jgi:hypothetical protein
MPKSNSKHGNLTGKAVRVYEALRREGMSKGKAARIANASKAGTIDYKRKRKRK